jgi:hypothetical protein
MQMSKILLCILYKLPIHHMEQLKLDKSRECFLYRSFPSFSHVFHQIERERNLHDPQIYFEVLLLFLLIIHTHEENANLEEQKDWAYSIKLSRERKYHMKE